MGKCLLQDDYCAQVGKTLSKKQRKEIDVGVRRAAYSIIDGKGATYYGIGSAMARIAEIILRDQRATLTVCTPLPDLLGVEQVTASMPNLLGGNGVIQTLSQKLDSKEEKALKASAQVVNDAILALD